MKQTENCPAATARTEKNPEMSLAAGARHVKFWRYSATFEAL